MTNSIKGRGSGPWEDHFSQEFEPPEELMALARLGMIREASDHNDTCPRFELVVPGPKGETLRIWSDAADEQSRERPESLRFILSVFDPEDESDEEVCGSNSVHEIIQGIRSHASTWEAVSRIWSFVTSVEQLGLPRTQAVAVAGRALELASQTLTDEIDRARFAFLDTVFQQEFRDR